MSWKSFDLWRSPCCVHVTFARYLMLIGQCAKTGCLPTLHPALLCTAPHLWLQLLFLANSSSHPVHCGRNWTSSISTCLLASWVSLHGHGFLLTSLWRSHLLPDRQCPSWYGMFESHPCVFSWTKGWTSSRLSDGRHSTCHYFTYFSRTLLPSASSGYTIGRLSLTQLFTSVIGIPISLYHMPLRSGIMLSLFAVHLQAGHFEEPNLVSDSHPYHWHG